MIPAWTMRRLLSDLQARLTDEIASGLPSHTSRLSVVDSVFVHMLLGNVLPPGVTASFYHRFLFKHQRQTAQATYTHTLARVCVTALCPGLPRYQKGRTNLDFTEARKCEWQWHHWAICKSVSRSRQITTPAPHRLVFLQAGCPSCRPTNSVKAVKAVKCQ